MSSAGLRMLLLDLPHRQRPEAARSVLVGLSDELEDTMSMTGFLNFFDHFDTLDAGAVAQPAPERYARSDMMERIDIYPTHEYQGYKCRPGKPFPFGATLGAGWRQLLHLLQPRHFLRAGAVRQGQSRSPLVEIPFPTSFASATSGP